MISNNKFTLNYKDCMRNDCRKIMRGIMDYSIRRVCYECGGKAIPWNNTEEEKATEARN